MASFDFSSRKKPLLEYSLAGLADIILLLLIFFLLTSSFVTQFGIQVNLPRAETGSMTDNQNVTVAITSEGTYYVQQEQVASDRLLEAIRSARSGPTSNLILRADQEATIKQFAEVANIANALGMRVLMATERER